jgi:hypothetical protein
MSLDDLIKYFPIVSLVLLKIPIAYETAFLDIRIKVENSFKILNINKWAISILRRG